MGGCTYVGLKEESKARAQSNAYYYNFATLVGAKNRGNKRVRGVSSVEDVGELWRSVLIIILHASPCN